MMMMMIIISMLLSSLLLLLTKRLACHLVQKLQGRVTHTQKDNMFGRQRKKQEGQQCHQYEVANKYVFKCRLKVDSDDDDVTNDGRLFHAQAAATGKARRDRAVTSHWNNRHHWRAGTQTPPRADISRAIGAVGEVH